MPDNAQRDMNIQRLFEKMDYIVDKVTITQTEVSAIGAKVDDFSIRLRRLEERDEKHMEREEKLELLTTKMEAVIYKSEDTMEKLESKLEAMEKEVNKMKDDISALKENWRVLIGISTFISGVAGYAIKTLFDVMLR